MRSKRFGLSLAAAAALVCLVRPASAHPLGEQSVDHYSEVEITPDKATVVYTEDLAEVATFQEMKRLGANADEAEKQAYGLARAREEAPHLQLAINGSGVPLTPASAKVFFLPGQGTLPTMRLIATFESSPGVVAAALRGTGPQTGTFRDDNEPNRLGWRQIALHGVGTRVIDQSVGGQAATISPQGFATDRSGNQSDVRAVGFHYVHLASGPAQIGPATPVAVPTRQRNSDSFASLMTAENLTHAKMWWLLLFAAGLGGLHALSPGHGKTLVAAYLVGSRGTAWHALILGLVVTFTHTVGVFALGLVTLFASRYLLPETLYPWLTAISGLVIAQVGLLRLLGRGGPHQHGHGHESAVELEHRHAHAHGLAQTHAEVAHHWHVHTHEEADQEPVPAALEAFRHEDHGHHHHLPAAGEAITWRSLLALGVSGGLVPCPSALVVLLSAVALHRIGFGLALIVAFSAGLAMVLTAIGIAMVYARDFLSRRLTVPAWFSQLVPKLGAALIMAVGLAIALPAIMLLARRY